jgi:hypothetical protein
MSALGAIILTGGGPSRGWAAAAGREHAYERQALLAELDARRSAQKPGAG